MTSHPGIGKIVFPGSTAIGKRIMLKASGNLKRPVLALRLECAYGVGLRAWRHPAGRAVWRFGGIKRSGIGIEFGQHVLAEYTSIQTRGNHESLIRRTISVVISLLRSFRSSRAAGFFGVPEP